MIDLNDPRAVKFFLDSRRRYRFIVLRLPLDGK